MPEAPLQENDGRGASRGSHLIDAVRFSANDAGSRREAIAEEVPVALVYNHFPFAVMLATPTDLDDLAVGFSLTEAIVADAGEISGITTRVEEEGVEVNISVTRERYLLLRERHRRSLVVGSSCGLCGGDSFAEVMRPIDPVVSRQSFAPSAIYRAIGELSSLQVLNKGIGAFHAAAFAEADGRIVAVREDIGRHNALDKLIGFLARHGSDRASGFVAVSSRCSYEMVRKTAAAQIPMIAAISAPTTLAVKLATAAEVGLVAFAREGRFSLYATPQRLSSEI